jgi:hypothetical protein
MLKHEIRSFLSGNSQRIPKTKTWLGSQMNAGLYSSEAGVDSLRECDPGIECD